MLKILFSTCFITLSLLGNIKPGYYHLEGKNPGNLDGYGYRGVVCIFPSGANYSVIWMFGNRGGQFGTGILTGDVLSVAFINHDPEQITENTKIFWDNGGVVSYRVISETVLRGTWAGHVTEMQGTEKLTWYADLDD